MRPSLAPSPEGYRIPEVLVYQVCKPHFQPTTVYDYRFGSVLRTIRDVVDDENTNKKESPLCRVVAAYGETAVAQMAAELVKDGIFSNDAKARARFPLLEYVRGANEAAKSCGKLIAYRRNEIARLGWTPINLPGYKDGNDHGIFPRHTTTAQKAHEMHSKNYTYTRQWSHWVHLPRVKQYKILEKLHTVNQSTLFHFITASNFADAADEARVDHPTFIEFSPWIERIREHAADIPTETLAIPQNADGVKRGVLLVHMLIQTRWLRNILSHPEGLSFPVARFLECVADAESFARLVMCEPTLKMVRKIRCYLERKVEEDLREECEVESVILEWLGELEDEDAAPRSTELKGVGNEL